MRLAILGDTHIHFVQTTFEVSLWKNNIFFSSGWSYILLFFVFFVVFICSAIDGELVTCWVCGLPSVGFALAGQVLSVELVWCVREPVVPQYQIDWGSPALHGSAINNVNIRRSNPRGGVLPYIGYTGMWHSTGYGVCLWVWNRVYKSAFLSWIGHIFCPFWLWNTVTLQTNTVAVQAWVPLHLSDDPWRFSLLVP